MKTMQAMPDIWDDLSFQTSREAVFGALACWSVRQSPYLVPVDFAVALVEFDANFIVDKYFEASCKMLSKSIRSTFDSCPVILGWNIPKKTGRDRVIRMGKGEAPHYDFIDLDALARNVAHAVTVEEKYRQLNR